MTVYKVTMTVASAYADLDYLLTSDDFAEVIRSGLARLSDETNGVSLASTDLAVQLPVDPADIQVVYADDPDNPAAKAAPAAKGKNAATEKKPEKK